jgi:hypothetical protein
LIDIVAYAVGLRVAGVSCEDQALKKGGGIMYEEKEYSKGTMIAAFWLAASSARDNACSAFGQETREDQELTDAKEKIKSVAEDANTASGYNKA